MALNYLLDPLFQIENSAGKPATGGWLEVYIHGTRTKYYCASDFDGTLHPFKVPLDSLGSNIVLADDSQAYDVYAYNRYGSLLMSRYNVAPGQGGGSGSGGTVGEMQHWLGGYGPTYTPFPGDNMGHTLGISKWGLQNSEIDYVGDFIDRIGACPYPDGTEDGYIYLKPGLYYVNCIIRYQQDPEALSNTLDEVLVYTGYGNANESLAYQLDSSGPEATGNRHNLRVSFVRHATENDGNLLYFAPATPVNWKEAYIQKLEIVKLDSVAVEGGSGLEQVHHDSTMTGSGTLLDPLSIQDTVDTLQDAIDEKQDKLTAGANITIDENNVISATGGGASYTAGAGIDITNDVISTDIDVQNAQKVDVSLDFGDVIQTVSIISTDGSTVRTDGFNFTLPSIKAGDGVELTKSGTATTISIDSEVGDVVETVEKLKRDLDTQITTNFDMPNISQVYDFADGTNWITHNGACMLYQSFTIPINHELRTTTDDENTPTLLGIYAQQNFAHKIMLALYEYTYAAEGEEAGSSTYVGDTGPVTVLKGMNEFPLKNRNPSITELRSDKVYYASLYLPSTAFVNGLYLAGCPGYGNASIPAEPRLTCATENIIWNGEELDLDDPTATLNHYQVIQIPGQDTYYQYYIGPWVGGYNERWSSPRFYMQIRNGEYNVPVVPTVPFNTLGDSKLPRGGILASNLPNFSASTANSAFRDVTPMTNVTITSFEWIDSMATAGGWEAGNCVFSSDYATNLSGNSNTVTDLGSQYTIDGRTAYAHRVTFTTPITLTAGTTYRFLCTSFASASDWIWSWTDPTDVFDATNNGWYVDWSQNVSRYSHIAGQYNKLYDDQNNHYVI